MWWKSHLYSNRHQKWTFRLVYFYKVSHYIYGNNLFWEINSNVSPFLRVRFFEGATPARKIVRPKHFFWLWLSQKSIWLVFGRADRGGTKNFFCPSPRSSVRKNAFSYLPAVDEKVVFGNLPGWKSIKISVTKVESSITTKHWVSTFIHLDQEIHFLSRHIKFVDFKQTQTTQTNYFRVRLAPFSLSLLSWCSQVRDVHNHLIYLLFSQIYF